MKIFKKIIIFLYLISFLTGHKISAQEKIKIGLLVPISGPDSRMGNSIIKSVRLAINRIDNSDASRLVRMLNIAVNKNNKCDKSNASRPVRMLKCLIKSQSIIRNQMPRDLSECWKCKKKPINCL